MDINLAKPFSTFRKMFWVNLGYVMSAYYIPYTVLYFTSITLILAKIV